jgi:Xaa-Pro aminopeptidase
MIKFIFDSTKNPDLKYNLKLDIGDPVFWIDLGRKKYLFLDCRESGYFKSKNRDLTIEVFELEKLIEEANEKYAEIKPSYRLVYHIFKKFALLNKTITVANDFPIHLADFLRNKKVKINPIANLYEQRKVKDNDEIKKIRGSLKANQTAFRKIEEILRRSVIKKNRIYFKNKILTSEFLKKEAETELFMNGMITPEEMIISSGGQTAFPHHTGEGPIIPNAPIIVDIFPKNYKTGYFADMTRTYVKGQPTEKMVKLYETVKKVQTETIKLVRPGIKCKKIHEGVVNMFHAAGYDHGETGFMHGTGHGIGLEVHEAPGINSSGDETLRPGNIITIEPGLYYPDIGGARIEDVVLVTDKGYEVLTNYPKNFIIG